MMQISTAVHPTHGDTLDACMPAQEEQRVRSPRLRESNDQHLRHLKSQCSTQSIEGRLGKTAAVRSRRPVRVRNVNHPIPRRTGIRARCSQHEPSSFKVQVHAVWESQLDHNTIAKHVEDMKDNENQSRTPRTSPTQLYETSQTMLEDDQVERHQPECDQSEYLAAHTLLRLRQLHQLEHVVVKKRRTSHAAHDVQLARPSPGSRHLSPSGSE